MLEAAQTEAAKDTVERGCGPVISAEPKKGAASDCGHPFDSVADGTLPSLPNGILNGSISMKSTRRDRPEAVSKPRRKPGGIYLNKFRIPIYIQLCVVICILCGLCVMVVAVTTVPSAIPFPPSLCLQANFFLLCAFSIQTIGLLCWTSKDRIW
jgi:hypothetical protein